MAIAIIARQQQSKQASYRGVFGPFMVSQARCLSQSPLAPQKRFQQTNVQWAVQIEAAIRRHFEGKRPLRHECPLLYHDALWSEIKCSVQGINDRKALARNARLSAKERLQVRSLDLHDLIGMRRIVADNADNGIGILLSFEPRAKSLQVFNPAEGRRGLQEQQITTTHVGV